MNKLCEVEWSNYLGRCHLLKGVSKKAKVVNVAQMCLGVVGFLTLALEAQTKEARAVCRITAGP